MNENTLYSSKKFVLDHLNNLYKIAFTVLFSTFTIGWGEFTLPDTILLKVEIMTVNAILLAQIVL